MNHPLEIVIVGGGTSGWMTAAALSSLVDKRLARIRLIESDDISTVGVGEATLPQMKDFNEQVGIIEAEMMRKTNATFKLGIEFVDWGQLGSSYIHPFGLHGQPIGGVEFHHQWLRARAHGFGGAFDDYCYAILACRQNKFELPGTDKTAVNAAYSYAYHFDAHLYAQFLRRFAEMRGLQRTEGEIVEVTQDSLSGDIQSVTLKSGAVIAGDYFIDCSGFRALLIDKTLSVAFEDWSQWLPCDRAWAVPCENDGRLPPYTRSTAREAGWQWRIPLQHRCGNGYVFASNFVSEQQAADTLMANLPGKALGDPRLIKFKAGRRTASWSRNCIAIGLSSGFLEPLESTSIYLVQVAIQNLLGLFPRRGEDAQALRLEFNRRVDNEYDRVRDFLILHYHANTRTDSPLWTYCRHMPVPDSLVERLALWSHRAHVEKYKDGLFAPPSWLAVYLGQGIVPNGYDRLADNVPLEQLSETLARLRQRIADRVALMPDHAAMVADFAAMGAMPSLSLGAARA